MRRPMRPCQKPFANRGACVAAICENPSLDVYPRQSACDEVLVMLLLHRHMTDGWLPYVASPVALVRPSGMSLGSVGHSPWCLKGVVSGVIIPVNVAELELADPLSALLAQPGVEPVVMVVRWRFLVSCRNVMNTNA